MTLNSAAGIDVFVPEALGVSGPTGRLLRRNCLKGADQRTFMARRSTKNKGAVRCDAH